jgi:hypothetical protein
MNTRTSNTGHTPKNALSRRGEWNGGRWRARARFRNDLQLLILEYVDVWLPSGSFLGRFPQRVPCADQRSIDRMARKLIDVAAPAA